MIKKIVQINIILISLFCLNLNVVNGYDYIDSSNSKNVDDMITDIYDAKQQYEDLAGEFEEPEVELYDASPTNTYWWPIGSERTHIDGVEFARGEPETVYISSNFGYRDDPFGRGGKMHSGLDIAGGRGLNAVNIIAVKDGIVVYPTANAKVDCPSSNSLSDCGGGYGNYVIIQHGDGNYTLYGHLYENSITVKEGDSVKQGQVIAKMGTSGNSTGPHLHFEVREGSNTYASAVDPLNYVDPNNPRATATVVSGESNKQTVCLSLKSMGYDDTAIMAIMESIEAESTYFPGRIEGDNVEGFARSIEYTNNVDSGIISEESFVNNGPGGGGYGLVQWTYHTRKQKLYTFTKEENTSIGDINTQLKFLYNEMTSSYPEVDNYLKSVSNTVSQKAYKFCRVYENPAGDCHDRERDAIKLSDYVTNGCQE